MLVGEIKIFGIRHHGAGSARRLKNALNSFQPDAVVIELPADSQSLISELQNAKHKPPIAFLYYDVDQTSKSIYLPMAVFSPEYQALLYAFENKIPIHCMDIPASASLHTNLYFRRQDSDSENKYQHITNDPIGYLATQAGYEDAESWWESHFEQWHDHEKLFSIVQDLMGELRRQSKGIDDFETLAREQFMRCRLREWIHSGHTKIAVICGAWHGPVLTPHVLENTHLEGEPDLKLTTVRSCLIPWSYKHLSLNQNYTAGIKAPLWHESMYLNSQKAPASFLTKAAQVLRKEGFAISPASVIDANYFADQLALLRELPCPGLEELIESSVLHFGHGMQHKIEWFREKIMCGETIGQINLNHQTLPFVKLFYTQLKILKLNRYWKETPKESLLLDLRKDKHLLISQFLQLCTLMEIPWNKQLPVDWNTLGSFHESWTFQWHPDLEMVLIQRGLLGNTLVDACIQYIKSRLHQNTPISEIAQWLEHSLKANIEELWPLLSQALDDALIQNQDYLQLTSLIHPLVAIRDFGSLHKTDIHWLLKVLSKLIPKLIISLPDNTKYIPDDRARKMLSAIINLQNYFNRYPDDESSKDWYDQLQSISENRECNPLIRGKCWSLLLEKNKIQEVQFLNEFQLEFSLHSEIPRAALWLEGFLQSQTTLFLMHPSVVKALDKWLLAIDPKHFKNYLPLLRRCFSQISTSERMRIFRLVHHQSNLPSLRWRLNDSRKNILLKSLEKLSSPE
ncbi:MAG: hypothetical protein IPM92_01290 [Saprospiraceae bacterium]|nr:hypothetical protein [Saprospiraceae bacterium]